VRAREDPERRAVSLELREDLREALEELPERRRLLVTLRDVEGLDLEEISELLAPTPGNARVLLHRGRVRLRAMLADELEALPLAF
jgi:RNA polymerase sigma-70 factor (ECF subfamily)